MMTRFLEKKLGRTFNKDASVTTRRYVTGEVRKRDLLIDDIASTTGLIVKVDEDGDGLVSDETALVLSTDLLLRGEGLDLDPDQGSEPQPWVELWIPPFYNDARITSFPPNTLVSVTAIHGWPAIPSAIVRAMYQLTGIWRLESPRATQRIPEGIEQAIASSPEAQSILDQVLAPYRRRWYF